jgi:hypothetical protein
MKERQIIVKANLWLSERLDLIAAVTAVILSVVAVVISLSSAFAPFALLVGSVVFTSSTAYIVIRQRPLKTDLAVIGSENPSLSWSLLFWLIYPSTLVLLLVRGEIHHRPIIWFVIVSILVAIIFLQIMRSMNRRVISYILLQIMALGLIVRLAPVPLFYGIIGIDPWWHRMFAMSIILDGYVPSGLPYSGLPEFHLAVVSVMLMSGLGYESSVWFAVGIQQVVSVLFLFFIARILHSERAGLVAGLFFVTADQVVRLGFWLIPMGLALFFVYLNIYLLLKIANSPLIWTSLLIIGTFALILTHTVTSLFMLMILLGLWTGGTLYKLLRRGPICGRKNQASGVPAVSFMLFFAVTMVSWWALASGEFRHLVRAVAWGLRIDDWAWLPAATSYSESVVWEYLLGWLGFSLLGGLATVGLLWALKTQATAHLFSMAVATFGIGGLAVIGLSMDLSGTLPQRWIIFSQYLFLLFGGVAAYILYSLSNSAVRRNLTVILVTLSSFLMITSPAANIDTSVYSDNTLVRFGLFESEAMAYNWVERNGAAAISTDIIPRYYALYGLGLETYEYSANLVSRDFSDVRSDLLVARRALLDEPIMIRGRYQLDYDLFSDLTRLGFHRIYESGSATVFLKDNTSRLRFSGG